MKESAQIALSYLRSNGPSLGLPVGELAERGVHLHVPAGAVPKDGPSAGITMTTALASLLSGRLVRADVAMTGEVSLTGRVLPIGGLKQKLLAAHRAGITTVLIPARNEPDLDDVPEKVREALEIHLVSDVREVLGLALEPAAAAAGDAEPELARRLRTTESPAAGRQRGFVVRLVDPAVVALPVRGAQLELLQLAGRRPGQRVAQLDRWSGTCSARAWPGRTRSARPR